MSENQKPKISRFVAESEAMKVVMRQVEKVARYPTTVLLTGETGVGKERIASAIHEKSTRANKCFKAVNSGGLHTELIQSELFGHVKGAYTGAETSRRGAFELADGGTLFLDEVGEMPPEIQVKFLRVLEEQQFARLGDEKLINVDVRIIAATNRNLDQLVKENKFRLDLYYRLNVFPIHIPPLRERLDEIPELVKAFIDKINKFMEKDKKFTPIEGITQTALKYLQSQRHIWEGNIRELQNVVERAIVYTETEELKREDFHVDMNRDLSNTQFERFMSERGISEEEINAKYKRRKGPKDREALWKTLSALINGRPTFTQLENMDETKRTEKGYVSSGAVNLFVENCSELFFGVTYNPRQFVNEAREVWKQGENDLVDTSTELENANDPPKV